MVSVDLFLAIAKFILTNSKRNIPPNSVVSEYPLLTETIKGDQCCTIHGSTKVKGGYQYI